ncbi:methyl-accepting chemotaxis protein [Pseudomethylobacillus aquaticus]|uniref:Methyl-accepting chemotaxis protein n=1 Tax=Pseudomethylobacillus aquaticus TaxID=2676064 RepID=A0A3N0V0F4_9PROT|nr:methyl-accepting chemotaxis protein [Pseudomethylobacillus aquaticus]ROH86240.1 methyl-accepting chemotaxis protein [Pseudomethylobacillus aquaticus]
MISTEYFIDLLTNPNTVWVFVLIILVVFIIPFLQAIFSIRKLNLEIEIAVNELKKLGADNRYQNFYDYFDKLDQSFKKIPSIQHAWDEFIESVFIDTPNRRIFISHRPAEYFNRNAILNSKLNLPQFLAFPNYLIGLGLFFTFIGLAAALHVAQEGLADGKGQDALKNLLAVASVKFISSIAGVGSSLVLSWVQRSRLKNFQNNLNQFTRLLEEYTEYKSTEKLLHENYAEQQKHTLALNDMATNISNGIGEVLSNQLPASVAAALEPLANEIRNLAQKFTGSSENALEKVLQEFLAQLRQSSGDDMNGLIESVKSLRESLNKLVLSIEIMSKNFGTDTKESSARLASVLDSFITTFLPVQQGIGQFGEALNALEIIANKIQNAGASISGAADVNNKTSNQLAEAVNQIATNFNPLSELLKLLNESLAKISNTAEQLKSAGGTIALASGDFKNSASSIDNAGQRFNANVKVFGDAAEGIADTISALERASNQVSNSTQPLSQASLAFTSALEAIKATEARIQQNQGELQIMLKALEAFSETIPSLWNHYEARFNKVDNDLGNAFTQLAEGSESFRSSVEVYVKALNDQFADAVSKLSGAINELTDEREQNASKNQDPFKPR